MQELVVEGVEPRILRTLAQGRVLPEELTVHAGHRILRRPVEIPFELDVELVRQVAPVADEAAAQADLGEALADRLHHALPGGRGHEDQLPPPEPRPSSVRLAPSGSYGIGFMSGSAP